jgi:hypothetical protein
MIRGYTVSVEGMRFPVELFQQEAEQQARWLAKQGRQARVIEAEVHTLYHQVVQVGPLSFLKNVWDLREQQDPTGKRILFGKTRVFGYEYEVCRPVGEGEKNTPWVLYPARHPVA